MTHGITSIDSGEISGDSLGMRPVLVPSWRDETPRMITAKMLFLGGGTGAALTVVTAVLTVNADALTLVERYGLLGLHAAVVLGLGGFIVRMGWEMVRTGRRQAVALEKIADRQDEAAEAHAEILRELRELHRKR